MRFVTSLGGPAVLDIVFVAAVAVLLIARGGRDILFLLLASPGTVLLVQILKPAVGRRRPAMSHLTVADGASWPSGHASSSMALYGTIVILLLSGTHGPRWRRVTAVALVGALLALIGLSRVVLGVHYASDVLAAWTLTAAWLVLLTRNLRRSRSGAPPARHSPRSGP